MSIKRNAIRATYTEEFKTAVLKSVKRHSETPISMIAEAYRIPYHTLYKWVKVNSVRETQPKMTKWMKENALLKAENAELQKKLNTLKEAFSILQA